MGPSWMNRIQLTKCEAEVMAVVWREGQVTVPQVLAAIDRDLAYTTVMTTMNILEEKKIVRRGEKVGRAYSYLPLVSREEVRHGMIQELAEQLFGGSVRSLVLSLVNSEKITAEDLSAMAEAADELEKS
tara:strand:- start:18565 stop:18951 length:387 start_codon:yes stop_codon:yes gene_type:complete